MNINDSQNLQICPVCRVSITTDGKVNFSNGNPGTRARLYARVCQYAKNSECINQESQLIGEINRKDYFDSGEDLQMPVGIQEQ